MKQNSAEQLDFFKKPVAEPPKPKGGATDEKGGQKKSPRIPRIFNQEDLKRILGDEEKSKSGFHGHPTKRERPSGKGNLGWAGEYYGNNDWQ